MVRWQCVIYLQGALYCIEADHCLCAPLASLTQLIGIHLYVCADAWAFDCLRDLPALQDASVQFTSVGAGPTAQLLGQQRLTELMLKGKDDGSVVPQVSAHTTITV